MNYSIGDNLLVKIPVASLRAEARHASEMTTQAVMGTPLRVLEVGEEWIKVLMPDSYEAHIPVRSVVAMPDVWKQSKRCIVTAKFSSVVEKAGGMIVCDLVMGCILTLVSDYGEWFIVETPDGRRGYVNRNDVDRFDRFAAKQLNPHSIIRTAYNMMGSGYLWGGTSTKMTDCSGLVKVCYANSGVILRRDASQMAKTGKIIPADKWRTAVPGTLAFFGKPEGKVTHVGIYISNGNFIHCSGEVKVDNLKTYADNTLLSLSVIEGMVGTDGITTYKDNEWYF